MVLSQRPSLSTETVFSLMVFIFWNLASKAIVESCIISSPRHKSRKARVGRMLLHGSGCRDTCSVKRRAPWSLHTHGDNRLLIFYINLHFTSTCSIFRFIKAETCLSLPKQGGSFGESSAMGFKSPLSTRYHPRCLLYRGPGLLDFYHDLSVPHVVMVPSPSQPLRKRQQAPSQGFPSRSAEHQYLQR